MGRGTKTCLGCGALLLIACCICSVVTVFAVPLLVGNLLAGLGGSADPVRAKQVAAQIADYTLPAGHSEQAGVDVLVLQMAVIAPTNFSENSDLSDGYVIMLLATKLPVDSAQLEKQMRDALLEQTKANGVTLQKVGERQTTIRGQPVTLSILEDDPQRATVRAVSGTFQGKGGQTLVLIFSAADLWNWTTVESFLGSIR